MRRRLKEDTDKPEVNVRDVLVSLGSAKTIGEGIGLWREVSRTMKVLLSIELLYIIPNIMFPRFPIVPRNLKPFCCIVDKVVMIKSVVYCFR